jgi:hypothetical protein
MAYFDPVNDPWFRTDPDPVSVESEAGPMDFYLPSRAVAVMGCVEEQELCNPAIRSPGEPRGRCRRFTQKSPVKELLESLELERPAQLAVTQRLLASLLGNSLRDMAWTLSQPIVASKTLNFGRQYAQLPDSQWRAEVGRWFSISLIRIQSAFVESVTGPADPALQQHLLLFNDTDGLQDCARQRVRNVAGVRNFHAAAILIVVVLGVCVIAVGSTLDTVVAWCQRRLRVGEAGRLRWLLDGLFQQQRLAYEAVGVGGWRDTDTQVPTTQEDDFPSIDASDLSHPRLRQRGAWWVEEVRTPSYEY